MAYKAFIFPAAGIVFLALGFVIFGGLNDNLVYYLTPAEAVEQRADFPDGERFRVGGLVTEGSIVEAGGSVSFVIEEGGRSVDVRHEGAPPQLFRDNVGVVLEGAWNNDVFEADTLIIKHDEEYRSVDGEDPYVPPTEPTG
jgi:cytochrome c-type biogenesis protein CcmE